MTESDWQRKAELFIRREVIALPQMSPPGYGAMVRYETEGRRDSYTATIQRLAPGVDDEIVLLSTGPVPVPDPLVDAILQLDQIRPDLTIDPAINFQPQANGMPVIHYLRLRRKRLESLEGYQARLAERILSSRPILVEGIKATFHSTLNVYSKPTDSRTS